MDYSPKYQKSCLQAEERTTQEDTSNNICTRFRTCEELLQSVKRVAEEPNELSVTVMTQLEEELSAALMHTRTKKTEMIMEHVSTLHEKERKLYEEKEELKQQVLSAKNQNDGYIVDGGGGLNNFATNQTNSPKRFTLPLF